MKLHMSARRGGAWLSLIPFLVACAAVSLLGGAVTRANIAGWYRGLAKPDFNPPDWVFAPVWTTLYLFIAVAGWRVWRAGRAIRRDAFARPVPAFGLAMTAWLLQLVLNLAWSFLFFGGHWLGVALAEIVLLWLAILATLWLFSRIDRPAAVLFLPYLAWVSYATTLNFWIWRLN